MPDIQKEFLDLNGLAKYDSKIKYYIDNAIISHSGGAIYSLEERRIGTYIDGKPVYQRSYLATTPSKVSSNSQSIGVVIPNLDTLVKLFGTVKTADNFWCFLPINDSAGSLALYASMLSTGDCDIRIYLSGSYYASQAITITAEYTKTTEQASINIVQNTYLTYPSNTTAVSVG